MNTEIKIHRIGNHLLDLPKQQTEFAAGFDLCCREEQIALYAHTHMIVSTGFAWEIPTGYVGQIWPRSGLAAKHGIDVLAGVIDSDYRDEVRVILVNHGPDLILINNGDRIAQMLIVPIVHGIVVPIIEMSATVRGVKGFGSTGV